MRDCMGEIGDSRSAKGLVASRQKHAGVSADAETEISKNRSERASEVNRFSLDPKVSYQRRREGHERATNFSPLQHNSG